MRKWFISCLTLLVALGATSSFAAMPTTQVDALIEKLIDKGILTKDDADNLKGQIAYDAKQIQEVNVKKDLPDWVQNFKLGGDMRARVQTERRESGAGAAQGERVRARVRARLNFETKVNDKAKVVIGIATDGGSGATSSSSNARSNNYTNSTYVNGASGSASAFVKPYIVLNKAYGQYTFNDNWSVMAGKMDNQIWEPMEFLWDSDITPEGGILKYDYKVNDMVSVTSTANVFNLGEFNPSTSDPFMYVWQGIVTLKPMEKFDAKIAGMFTGYGNIKSGFNGGLVNNTSNTANGTNGLKYDYSAPTGAIELGLNDPFGDNLPMINVPRVAAFGEYTMNPSPDNKNTAWMAGAYIGNSKVSAFKAWKLTGAYKYIARDGWLDILPDSDFYSGQTGVKGVEAIFEFGLAKNLTFAIDYYRTRRIGSTVAKAPEHLVQYDINWKF